MLRGTWITDRESNSISLLVKTDLDRVSKMTNQQHGNGSKDTGKSM